MSKLSIFLILAFLFSVGSAAGWLIELIFRRFFSSSNKEKRWINPGFCSGPYLPLYGVGLCILYLIASLEQYTFIKSPFLNKIILFFIMAACMTAIEYIAGIVSLHLLKVRLWDYSDEFLNLNGIICPKFSFFWSLLGALYYFLIHPYILNSLNWLSRNLTFSFFIGLFFGIFIMDAIRSTAIIAKLKKYAEENRIIIRCEEIKTDIRSYYERNKRKYHFFKPFRSDKPLYEHIRELKVNYINIKK